MIGIRAAVGAVLASILLLAMPREANAQDARAFIGTLGEQAIALHLAPRVDVKVPASSGYPALRADPRSP